MQTTANTAAFIETQVYSQFILENLHDGLLPGAFYRDVTDFPSGTTLNIKVVGDAMLQDVEEDKAITYNPIDTSTITIRYSGDTNLAAPNNELMLRATNEGGSISWRCGGTSDTTVAPKYLPSNCR